jgi:hypothetical protein
MTRDLTVDQVARLAAATALLLAAAGLTQYFFHLLPAREVREEALRIENDAGNERMRRVRELTEERRKIMIQTHYRQCLEAASSAYTREWAASCAYQSGRARLAYPACVAAGGTKAQCADAIQLSADCALPRPAAEEATGHYERQRDRCLKELELGVGG